MAEKTVKGEMPETVTQVETEAVETRKVETPEEDEEFDKPRAMETIRKLREEAKQGSKAAKELVALKEAEQKRQEAEMSELQKAQKRGDELEARIAARDKEALQRKVADAVGLPAILASRLIGKDEDEMSADATKLLETLPKADPAKKQNPIINPTNPAAARQGENLAQQKARLGLTRDSNIWSENANEGGGAFLVET